MSDLAPLTPLSVPALPPEPDTSAAETVQADASPYQDYVVASYAVMGAVMLALLITAYRRRSELNRQKAKLTAQDTARQ